MLAASRDELLAVNLTINKSSGEVKLLSNLAVDAVSQTLTLTAGTLNLNGYALTNSVTTTTFNDTNVDDQVRAALKKLTADGSLTGLVLDNRMNGGGRSDVTLPILGFFTSGNLGKMVSRTGAPDVSTAAEDIGGSQRVPLVILTGPDTVSYGEIFSGVLQRSSRARTVGGRTDGNVELLAATNFEDGSRLWLATFAFAPVGLKAGAWEGVGIVPDVSVPTRWDLFTEATDPALAQAVAMLQK